MDAGFDQENLSGSLGASICDHTGKFIAAANERLSSCYDAFTAELQAAAAAVAAAAEPASTLEGPSRPVTVPLREDRGHAVDLPDTDPRVQRRGHRLGSRADRRRALRRSHLRLGLLDHR